MIVLGRNLARALGRRRRLLLGILASLLLLAGGAYAAAPHLRAWYHFRAGQRALERRAFAEARDHAAICLAVWPHGTRTHLLAARAARGAGLLEEARQHLDACPSTPEVLEELQLERLLLQAQRGGLASVEKLLLEEVELEHPQTPAILDVLTWQWMRRHRLGEVRQALDVWQRYQPDEAEILVRRGWTAERLDQNAEALNDYRQALALAPNRDAVRLRLGELLVSHHYGDEAAEQFEQLLRKQPDDPAVQLGLARARVQQARFEEAEQLLDELLVRQPNLAAALGERGRLALTHGQVERAETWLRRAAAAAPHDYEILYSLIQCLRRQQKQAEVEEYAVRLDRLDDDRRRMRELMKQVLKTPKSASLRCEIGLIFLRNDFREDGLRWLRTALEQDPTYQPARQALANYDKAQRTGNRE